MGRSLSLLGLFAIAAGLVALAAKARSPHPEPRPQEKDKEVVPAAPRLIFPATASFHAAFSLN
jgi:hypothetical protein